MANRSIRDRWRDASPAVRGLLAALSLVAIAALIALAALVISGALEDDDADAVAPARVAEVARKGGTGDPFAYRDAERSDFERRGALGYSHVLYEKSPGGIIASARRTARWRDAIERAAAAHGADPDLMEAMVLLESAGRPEVIAGDDPEVASGLAQIVASTGIDLLGMRVDLPRSQELTRRIAATEQEAAKRRIQATSSKRMKRLAAARRLRELARLNLALRWQRRRIDERFDPAAALDGMGRYLEIAEERFGRTDLAVASYHMGIGNLESVIGRFVGPAAGSAPVGRLVADGDLDYARLFFASSPLSHRRAWNLLSAFGDDSSTYLWRVLAAERIMRLYRDDRAELEQLDRLNRAKATAEEVFHPEAETKVYADPGEIEAALAEGELVAIPEGRKLGYALGSQLGELASDLDAERSLYRSLRPEALATLIYLSARVRKIAGGRGSLIVTSAIRDAGYQDALVGINPEATPEYSLHTTGYTFDILRRYRNDRQAEAFQFMLDRLRALAVIDYAVEPAAIHITVSDEAEALLQG